jgi:hypothetical protein
LLFLSFLGGYSVNTFWNFSRVAENGFAGGLHRFQKPGKMTKLKRPDLRQPGFNRSVVVGCAGWQELAPPEHASGEIGGRSRRLNLFL